MEFQYFNNAIYFLVVLAAILVLWLGWRKKVVILQQLNMVSGQPLIKNLCLITGMVLLVLAIMGPREEDGFHEVAQEGLDIYVLIDTSKSMLATDVAPSRLERAKKVVSELLSGLEGDRIGFIPYASSAYIQMPLTDDYDLAAMYLDVIDTDLIGGGGTDVLQAIELASRSFDEISGGQQIILVLSDGEAHDMDYSVLEDYQEHASFRIYAIGIGSQEGSLLPLFNGETGEVEGYMKDRSGNLITSRLDEGQLIAMARTTQGRYYHSDVALSEIDALIRDLSYLQRGQRSPAKIKLYKEQYQWFLFPSIMLLLLGALFPERRREV